MHAPSRSPAEKQLLHRLAQLQQPQQVGRGAARAADGAGCRLVGQAEFLGQALDAARFLERVEVLALHVLDQRHRRRRLVGHVAHQHRHALEAGKAGGADAALAGDDLEAVGGAAIDAAHEHRLHHALDLDALGQLVQAGFVHAGARLVAAGLQLLERQRSRLAVSRAGAGFGCLPNGRPEQRFEAEPEALGFLRHHRQIVPDRPGPPRAEPRRFRPAAVCVRTFAYKAPP